MLVQQSLGRRRVQVHPCTVQMQPVTPYEASLHLWAVCSVLGFCKSSEHKNNCASE